NLSSETEERENNLESLTADLHTRKTNLETLIAESSEEKNNLEEERLNIIKDISAPIISKYDRVFAARDGMAVVETFGTSCGGCGSIVPPQKIAELKQSKNLQTCDVCSRFLYWPAEND
ncbi:MAG: C4-type zinc ribbon domain-containing protein, partial [Candidatus Marinimicrobia bacterium]|nr:C4-type zinc ribbon domain-containing protein [Candidatus Neomarinimicrobiota bacterium]